MKKQWFMSLTLTLGLLGSTVFGQFAGGQYQGAQYSSFPQSAGQYSGTQYPGTQYPAAQGPGVQFNGNQFAGSQFAGGNYAGREGNFGASSYPVPSNSILPSVPQVPPAFNTQFTSAPQAQAGFSQPNRAAQSYGAAAGQYQLVTTQNQAYNQPGLEPVPSPAAQYGNSQYSGSQYPNQMGSPHTPAIQPGNTATSPIVSGAPYGPSASCQSCAPSTPSYFGATAAPGYSYAPEMTGIAPNCSTCGPAPISHAYASPKHTSFLCGLPAYARPWFFGVNYLLFNRVDDKDTPLSFFDNSYSHDVLTTEDARMGARSGFEVNVGRYFNCGRNAIEFRYWGIFSDPDEATRSRPTAGDYRSRIPFNYLMMPGTPADPMMPYSVYDWYDNAYTHSLRRDSEYFNFEVNLLGFAAGCAARNFNCPTKNIFGGHGCGSCGGSGCSDCASACGPTCVPPKMATGPCCLIPPKCGSRLNMTWLAGFRYFIFNDSLLYAASLNDSVVNRSNDDLYYEICAKNELAGFQTGGRLDFCIHKCVNLYGSGNVGIYNNHSSLVTSIGTDYDRAYLDDTRMPTNPNNGQDYAFHESKDDIAFLSEIGAGIGYRVSCCWSVTAGYRAIVASNVATAPGNLQTQFANYEHNRDLHNRSTLILHGFNIGGSYNF